MFVIRNLIITKLQSVCSSMSAITLRGGGTLTELVEALRYRSEGRGFDSRGVIRIFHLYNPSVRSMTDRNGYQEYFLGGKGGRCVGLTTFPPSLADCLETWEPQPPGTLRVCPGLYMECFTCVMEVTAVFVGPCHHGMARPQVAVGGTASDMEGSCE